MTPAVSVPWKRLSARKNEVSKGSEERAAVGEEQARAIGSGHGQAQANVIGFLSGHGRARAKDF